MMCTRCMRLYYNIAMFKSLKSFLKLSAITQTCPAKKTPDETLICGAQRIGNIRSTCKCTENDERFVPDDSRTYTSNGNSLSTIKYNMSSV